jgi:small-conductance mechanosensitive channel
MADPAPAADRAAASELLATAGGELLSLPEQAEELTRELFEWLRTDSLGLLAGIAIGSGLYLLMVLARRWARRRLARTAAFGSWGWVALKVLARTRSFFLVMASAEIVTALLGAPRAWTQLIGFLFTVAAVVQGAFWAREFLVALVERKASEREGDTTITSAVGVLTVIINIVVWAIAAIILLDNLGVNVTGLVAGLGIGGIAIGLAAQGIFSDLFAALSILLDQPFRRGDTIQVGGPQGVIGTVEHIGLKTTRLRALSGEIVVMSNANLLNQQINNFADFSFRRVVLPLTVIYQTDAAQLAGLPAELERIVNAVPDCRFDRAHLVSFAASSLDYELVFFVDKPGLVEMFDARHAVMLAIVGRLRALGIDFAFPTQTSLLAGPDGRIVDPHPPGGRGARPHPVQAAPKSPA